jgi:hypothetical protein
LLRWEAYSQHLKVRGWPFEYRNAVDRIVACFEPAHRSQSFCIRRRLELDETVSLRDQLILGVRAKLVVAYSRKHLEYVLYESSVSRKNARDHLSNFKSARGGPREIFNFYSPAGSSDRIGTGHRPWQNEQIRAGGPGYPVALPASRSENAKAVRGFVICELLSRACGDLYRLANSLRCFRYTGLSARLAPYKRNTHRLCKQRRGK